jgi:hypothetical protein
MPIAYEVRNGGIFVYTTASGEVTDQDLLGYQEALLSDPRVKSGFDELFDARMAEGTGLSTEVVEKIIEVDRTHTDKLQRGKCAVVVRSDFELARHFEERHGGPQQIMVFHNLNVALVWLGREIEAT